MNLIFKNLSPAASAFLLGAAHGKYDADIAAIDQALSMASGFIPQVAIVKEILDGLVELNKQTAPLAVQSDGQGGFVPTTNSHYDPKTGEFL